MRLFVAAAALAAATAPAALAATPGSFELFDDIPQFGIYDTTQPAYTPPPGVIMWNYGTEFLIQVTPDQQARIGANVSAKIEYLAQCDNYDRIGALFVIVKPHGVVPTQTDTPIELVRWITPFSDYTQGRYATHVYPLASLAPFEGVLADTTHDIWIGILGGSNPYSGDPCTGQNVTPYFASVGFSYSIGLVSTTAAIAKSAAVSTPVPVDDYTTVPVTGSATTTATGAGTAVVIVSGHGSDSGGDEYKHTMDTLSVNASTVGSFNTEANCSSYRQYSPDGNPFLFLDNSTSNPRNWCPGALVPSRSFAVTLGASNDVSLGMSDPSVPSGSYYDTSIALIPN